MYTGPKMTSTTLHAEAREPGTFPAPIQTNNWSADQLGFMAMPRHRRRPRRQKDSSNEWATTPQRCPTGNESPAPAIRCIGSRAGA